MDFKTGLKVLSEGHITDIFMGTYPIHLLLCLLLKGLEAVVHGGLERGGSWTGRVLWR
jgi:hypothetical protein